MQWCIGFIGAQLHKFLNELILVNTLHGFIVVLPLCLQFILKLAEDIPSEDLLPIIVEKLDSGQNEILKTSNFNLQATAVFNQLVGENAPEVRVIHLSLK